MKGTVYSIVETSTKEKIYIGSTKTKLSKRKAVHLCYCFTHHSEIPVHAYIRDICNDKSKFSEMFYFEELYSGEFSNTKELRKMELEYQKKFKPKLNIMKSWVDKSEGYNKEWYRENKDKVREKNRRYREKNKNRILQSKKIKYRKNKDEVLQQKKEYYAANRERMLQQKKEYYAANRERILQQKKEYRAANKDEILRRRKIN